MFSRQLLFDDKIIHSNIKVLHHHHHHHNNNNNNLLSTLRA